MAAIAVAVFVASCGGGAKEQPLENAEDSTAQKAKEVSFVESIDMKTMSVDNQLQSLKMEEVHYEDPEQYWMSGNYTAYLDGDKLVKLVEATSDEGYNVTNSYYFENGKVYFLFQEISDAEGTEEQKSIYITDDKVVDALTKLKDVNDMRTFEQIEKKPDLEIIDKEDNNTKAVMSLLTTALDCYKKAKEVK